jgi:hypothetical protein
LGNKDVEYEVSTGNEVTGSERSEKRHRSGLLREEAGHFVPGTDPLAELALSINGKK